jgi:AcrR family transcriptional regulator
MLLTVIVNPSECDLGYADPVSGATTLADDGLTKGGRTRARLLEIAVRRFAVHGYRRTSVADVAREAGVTPAAVYGYFSGKEGLFEAAVDADAGGLIGDALGAVGGSAGLQDRWPALFAQLLAGLDHHPLARRVLTGQEPDVLHRIVALPSLLDLRATVAGELRHAQREGRLRPEIDPEAMATGLETVVISLLISQLQTAAVDQERWVGVLAVLHAALDPPTPDGASGP